MIIDVKQQVSNLLPIEPVKLTDGTWAFNGLCPVVLSEVTLGTQTDEKGEFKDVPRLVLKFVFNNYKLAATEPDRFLIMSEKAVGTKQNDNGALLPRSEADIHTNNNDMFKRIKHILDNCSSSPTFRNIETLDTKTLNENFDLPGIVDAATEEEAVAIRVAAYNKFFTFMHNWFNGGGEGAKAVKPIIYNAKDEPIIQGWLKLLPNHPSKKFYTTPTWVGTGFFEYAAINSQTKALNKAIKLKVKATESLELNKASAQVTAAPHASGMPPAAVEGVDPAVAAWLASQQG